eukprot:gene7608-7810_t
MSFLAKLQQLQHLTLRFPDLSKHRRRHFDVSTLRQLTNLQQLTINADWAFFWKGPFTKPALYKQLATLLPQLTTLKQLRLKHVVLPDQPQQGLAGLTQLRQLELLSLDHVVPFITPDAASKLASSLTALTSLAINQCYHSPDAHRIMEALQPLLPRLCSLSLPNHRGQTQDCVDLLKRCLEPSSLRALDVSKTKLFPDYTSALAELTGLQDLSVSQCLQQLRHLDISWAGQLDEQGVAALQRLPKLQVLVAQWKLFTPSAICKLGRLTGLRHLDVSNSNVVALGSISVVAMVQLSQLTALHTQAPKQRRAAGADDASAEFAASLHKLAALTGLKQLDLARVPLATPDVAGFVMQLRDLQWLRIEVFSRDYRDYKQQLQRRWQERVVPQQGQDQRQPQQQRRSTLNAVLARKYGDSAEPHPEIIEDGRLLGAATASAVASGHQKGRHAAGECEITPADDQPSTLVSLVAASEEEQAAGCEDDTEQGCVFEQQQAGWGANEAIRRTGLLEDVSLFSQLLVSRIFEALRWLVGCVTFVGIHGGGVLGAARSWLSRPWGGGSRAEAAAGAGLTRHEAYGSGGRRWSDGGCSEGYGGSRRLQRRSTTSLDLPCGSGGRGQEADNYLALEDGVCQLAGTIYQGKGVVNNLTHATTATLEHRARAGRPHHVRRLILLSPAGFHPVIPALFKPVAAAWPVVMWLMRTLWRQQAFPMHLPTFVARLLAFKMAVDSSKLPAVGDLLRALARLLLGGDR